jgi:hypothetical protein
MGLLNCISGILNPLKGYPPLYKAIEELIFVVIRFGEELRETCFWYAVKNMKISSHYSHCEAMERQSRSQHRSVASPKQEQLCPHLYNIFDP